MLHFEGFHLTYPCSNNNNNVLSGFPLSHLIPPPIQEPSLPRPGSGTCTLSHLCILSSSIFSCFDFLLIAILSIISDISVCFLHFWFQPPTLLLRFDLCLCCVDYDCIRRFRCYITTNQHSSPDAALIPPPSLLNSTVFSTLSIFSFIYWFIMPFFCFTSWFLSLSDRLTHVCEFAWGFGFIGK